MNILIYLAIFLFRIQFGSTGTIETIIYSKKFLLIGMFVYVLLMFLYYLGFLYAEKFTFKLLIAGYIIFSLILIITPFINSYDTYSYISHGRTLSIYHQNPYLFAPIDFPEDPFLKFACPAWSRMTLIYGPLWSLFSAILSKIGGSFIYFTFSIYKLWAVIGSSLSLFLTYKISQLNYSSNLKKNFYLYAWNPFILIEFANNAHNDVWMIFFGLLAYYCYCRKKDALIIPLLLLAGMIKYIFWALIPIYLIFLYKQKRINLKTMLFSAFFSVLVLCSVFLPFISNLTIIKNVAFHFVKDQSFNYYNPLLMIFFILTPLIQMLVGKYLITAFFYKTLLLSRLIFVFNYTKQLFWGKNLINIIIVCLISSAIFFPVAVLPWYLTWCIPFLILKTNWRAIILWSLIGLLSYSFLYSVSISLFFIISLLSLYFTATNQKLTKDLFF